jgi:hypothetical protein
VRVKERAAEPGAAVEGGAGMGKHGGANPHAARYCPLPPPPPPLFDLCKIIGVHLPIPNCKAPEGLKGST